MKKKIDWLRIIFVGLIIYGVTLGVLQIAVYFIEPEQPKPLTIEQIDSTIKKQVQPLKDDIKEIKERQVTTETLEDLTYHRIRRPNRPPRTSDKLGMFSYCDVPIRVRLIASCPVRASCGYC